MEWPESFEAQRRSFVEGLRVRSYSKSTLKSYGQALSLFFRFLSGNGVDDLREVSRETIAAYQLWLSSQPYTVWTVHQRLQSVRRFFEHLEKTDAVLMNPCDALTLPKLHDRLPRTVLTKAEAKRVLDAPDTGTGRGIRDKAILELFYSTGIRLEEMTCLTIHDVDTKNGFVRVHRGKFAKDRVVPMGNKACDTVREYMAKVRAVWSKENRDERALWLRGRKPHGAIQGQFIAIMVREYGKAAGIEARVTPHVWRHTCATHMVSGGANIAYVQRLLGHRSLKTTQTYSRVVAGEAQQTHRKTHPRQKTKAKSGAVKIRTKIQRARRSGTPGRKGSTP